MNKFKPFLKLADLRDGIRTLVLPNTKMATYCNMADNQTVLQKTRKLNVCPNGKLFIAWFNARWWEKVTRLGMF